MSGAQRRRRRRPNTRNRSQPREERELRPRCITHLCARARSRRIVDINRQRMHRDQRSCACCWRIVAHVFFSRRRRSSLEKSFESPPLVLIVIRASKKWGLCQFEKIEKGKTQIICLSRTPNTIYISSVLFRDSQVIIVNRQRARVYIEEIIPARTLHGSAA